MMRIVLSLAALGLIFLGLWLIASGFIVATPSPDAPAQVVAGQRQTANPVMLGTALLAGSVVLFIVILRRK